VLILISSQKMVLGKLWDPKDGNPSTNTFPCTWCHSPHSMNTNFNHSEIGNIKIASVLDLITIL